MTLSIKDASGATQTIKTNDDMAGTAGTPNSNVLSIQGISGGTSLPVSVANLPATQAVVGTVSVANFPATQPISGAVSVANFPASQAIAGTVSVANFPATQPVSGAVSVANLPATQAITAATLPLPTGAATDASLGTIGTAPPSLPGSSTGIMGLLRWIGSLFTSGAGVASGALRVVLATDQTAVPVSSTPTGLAYTNRSGTIAAGGTAQSLTTSNSARKGFRVVNLSTADLWINDKGATAAASQPAFKIPAGAAYESPAFGVSTAAISIFGATAGQAFEAAEA